MKRIVLQAAQDQKLFRVYGGNGVFGVSEQLPKRLELRFNTVFDFINSVGHDKPCVIEADLTKIADDLKIKAVAPGVFPFMRLGDSGSDKTQVDFAFEPNPTRWSFLDGQLDIAKLAQDPDGDEPAPSDLYYHFDNVKDVQIKFYRAGIPDEAQHIQYTMFGVNAHWLDYEDSEGRQRPGLHTAHISQLPNFQRMIMTQICDTDFDPETWWKEHPGEQEEGTALFVVLAVIGRFFLPNNYRDRWELYPFCFGGQGLAGQHAQGDYWLPGAGGRVEQRLAQGPWQLGAL